MTNTQTLPQLEDRWSFLYRIKLGRNTAESCIEGLNHVSVIQTMFTILVFATMHNSSDPPFRDLTLAIRKLLSKYRLIVLMWVSRKLRSRKLTPVF